MQLAGGAALVTGGKRLGAAVARALAAAGMDVGLSYNKSRAEAEETAAAITAARRRAHISSANLGTPPRFPAPVARPGAPLGRPHVRRHLGCVCGSVSLGPD